MVKHRQPRKRTRSTFKMNSVTKILFVVCATTTCNASFVPQSTFRRIGMAKVKSSESQQTQSSSRRPSSLKMNFISTAEYHLSQHKPYAKLSTVAHQLSDTEKDVFHNRRQRQQLKHTLMQEIQQYQKDKLQKQQTVPFTLFKHSGGKNHLRSTHTTTQNQPNPQYDADIVYVWKLIWTSVMKHVMRPHYTHLMTIKDKGHNNKKQDSKLHPTLVRSSSNTEEKKEQRELLTSKEQYIISLAKELSKYNPTPQPLMGWKQQSQPSSIIVSPQIPAIQNGAVVQKISKLDQEILQQKQLSTHQTLSLQGNWKCQYSTVKEEEDQDFTTNQHHVMGHHARRQRQRRVDTKLQHMNMEKGTLTDVVDFDPESLKPQNTLVGSRVVYKGKDLSSAKSSTNTLLPKENDDNTNNIAQYNKNNNSSSSHKVSSLSSSPSLLDLQVQCIMFLFRQPPWWLLKSTQTLSIPIPTKFLKTMVHLFVSFKFKLLRLFSTGTAQAQSPQNSTTTTIATTTNDVSNTSRRTIQILYLDDDLNIHKTNQGHWVIQTRV